MYSSSNTRDNKYVAKIFTTNSAPVVQAGGQFELTHVWYTKQQFTGQMLKVIASQSLLVFS